MPPESIQALEMRSRKNAEEVSVTVPSISEETDSSISFLAGARMITLPKARVKLERGADGIRIRSTRAIFRAAGLTIE